MKDRIAALQSTRRSVGRWSMACAMDVAIRSPLTALPSFSDSGVIRQLIPIFGLTTDNRATGTVFQGRSHAIDCLQRMRQDL